MFYILFSFVIFFRLINGELVVLMKDFLLCYVVFFDEIDFVGDFFFDFVGEFGGYKCMDFRLEGGVFFRFLEIY